MYAFRFFVNLLFFINKKLITMCTRKNLRQKVDNFNKIACVKFYVNIFINF